ncbi:MAG: hypothetical protein HC834_04675 [Rhodospirillales bacterium]|nr:hypothetical protein [Rhodospirillales bacterium]
MNVLSRKEHQHVAQKPPLLLVFAILLATSLIAFHDFSFPFLMLDPTGDFSQNMAEAVAEGNVLRQFCLPVIGGLGAYLLYRPHRSRLRFNSVLGIVLLIYIVWAALSFTWAEDPSLSLRRVIVLVCLVVGAVGLASLDTRSIQMIFIGIILATFCVGLLNELALGTFAPWRATTGSPAQFTRICRRPPWARSP